MGEENGTIKALLGYVMIILSVFFIRPIGLKFTMIFSDVSHATSVGEGLGMVAFVLCLVGVVHYLNQANDHYMEELNLPFPFVSSTPSYPPSSSTPSKPPSSTPSKPSSSPSNPPSSSTPSYPPSSSTPPRPSSSPTPSNPPPLSTVASDHPSTSSLVASNHPSTSSLVASHHPSTSSSVASDHPSTSSSVASDHPSTSSSSSFSYPPPPPPSGKVKPRTYVVRGDYARMVSDDVSLRSEDFRFEVSSDSDIDTKAERFITEKKEKGKLETAGIGVKQRRCEEAKKKKKTKVSSTDTEANENKTEEITAQEGEVQRITTIRKRENEKSNSPMSHVDVLNSPPIKRNGTRGSVESSMEPAIKNEKMKNQMSHSEEKKKKKMI